MMNKLKFFVLIIMAISVTSMFSSCLKDTPFLDVSNTEPIIEFGISPSSGYYGPFGYTPENVSFDTTIVTPTDTVFNTVIGVNDTAIAVVLASPQVLNDTVVVTFVIDSTQIASSPATAGQGYTLLPDSLNGSSVYILDGDTTHTASVSLSASPLIPQTVNILPGHRVGIIPITLTLPTLPTSANYAYALPITIINAVDKENPSNLIVVSGNSGQFMWLFNAPQP